MVPANAPFPTTSSLPFHPLTGSHTSILMSDRGDRLSVAATRQNAGSIANGLVAPGPPVRPAGALNSPAPTVCVIVIVVVGDESDVSVSQVAADASAGTNRVNAASSRERMRRILSQPAEETRGDRAHTAGVVVG